MYSQQYLTQLKHLHAAKDRPRGFGGKVKDLGEFHTFMKQWNPKTVLDYGCGKGTLRPAVLALAPDLEVAEYDPAMPGKDADPEPVDVVVCIDVLEHIEPACLDDVLTHIQSLGKGGAFFIVDTVPAQKTLADGRNAHLIVEDLEWWRDTLSKYFNILVAQPIVSEQPERVLVIGVPLAPQ